MDHNPFADIIRLIVKNTPFELYHLWKQVCAETYQMVMYPDFESMSFDDLCKYIQIFPAPEYSDRERRDVQALKDMIFTKRLEECYCNIVKTLPYLPSSYFEKIISNGLKTLDLDYLREKYPDPIYEVFLLNPHNNDRTLRTEEKRLNGRKILDPIQIFKTVKNEELYIYQLEEFFLPLVNWDFEKIHTILDDDKTLYLEFMLLNNAPLKYVFEFVIKFDLNHDENIFLTTNYNPNEKCMEILKTYLMEHEKYPQHVKFLVQMIDQILWKNKSTAKESRSVSSLSLEHAEKIDYEIHYYPYDPIPFKNFFTEKDGIIPIFSLLIKYDLKQRYLLYYESLQYGTDNEDMWIFVAENDPTQFLYLFHFMKKIILNIDQGPSQFYGHIGKNFVVRLLQLYQKNVDKDVFVYANIVSHMIHSEYIKLKDIFEWICDCDEEKFANIAEKLFLDIAVSSYGYEEDNENRNFVAMVLSRKPDIVNQKYVLIDSFTIVHILLEYAQMFSDANLSKLVRHLVIQMKDPIQKIVFHIFRNGDISVKDENVRANLFHILYKMIVMYKNLLPPTFISKLLRKLSKEKYTEEYVANLLESVFKNNKSWCLSQYVRDLRLKKCEPNVVIESWK